MRLDRPTEAPREHPFDAQEEVLRVLAIGALPAALLGLFACKLAELFANPTAALYGGAGAREPGVVRLESVMFVPVEVAVALSAALLVFAVVAGWRWLNRPPAAVVSDR